MPITRRHIKKSQLERKSLGLSQGIHNSNASQLKKIHLADTSIERPQVPLKKLYMRVNKTWLLKGYTCELCNSMMNDQTVIDKHRYICKALNKKKRNKDAST